MLPVETEKTIYVVDGYGFVFRAFYAVPNLTTKTGEPIGAVFGFFKMLISLINSARPEYLVIALDTGKRTFRNEIYDAFIENRAIEELFNSPDCVNNFKKANITYNDVKSKASNELIKLLNVNKEKLEKFCENCGVDKENPPKILILLLFLELEKNVKVEDYKTQYKANRAPTPDALKSQFKIIRDLIDAMGLYKESSIGFEADDVIGSIAKEAVKNDFQVVIVSADKDLCQLVKDGEIGVYDPAKKVYLNEEGVFNKFGVKANQVRDYLSIIGDHCDNIFGINGIGPKGAVKLLTQYGSIANILEHLDELDEKTRAKFIASRDILELAEKLISLRYDAISVDNFEKYRLHLNHSGLANFIEKYGFKSLDKMQRDSGFLKHRNEKHNNDENNKKNNFAQKQGVLF